MTTYEITIEIRDEKDREAVILAMFRAGYTIYMCYDEDRKICFSIPSEDVHKIERNV